MRLRILGMLLAGSLALLAWRASAERAPALPFYSDSTLTPVWTADTARLHRIGEFSLTDQHGHTVSQLELNGRVTVVTFFYATCKDLCPRLQSASRPCARRFPTNRVFSSFRYPLRPSMIPPPVLAAYAKANHIAAPDWLLLTGARTEIDRVAHNSFFATTPVPRCGAGHAWRNDLADRRFAQNPRPV